MTAKNELDAAGLENLFKQGQMNGIDLKMISMDEAREMEPTLVGYGKQCIYSPTTSVMDTKEALDFLRKEAESEGVEI